MSQHFSLFLTTVDRDKQLLEKLRKTSEYGTDHDINIIYIKFVINITIQNNFFCFLRKNNSENEEYNKLIIEQEFC